MFRKTNTFIEEWFYRKTRKPLIIRGARQVGKTTTVTLAAKNLGVDLITINLEDSHSFISELRNTDPKSIFEIIALSQGINSIDPDKTIFFFDEAQEQPEVISFLRYCYERAPEFRVILTGSLLEFVLEAPSFSFPVGRVEFLFMGPMTFDEFLRGTNHQTLADKLNEFSFSNPISLAMHEIYQGHLRTYFIVGGMPEAVKVYQETNSWLEVSRVKKAILETYHADFGKYQGRTNGEVIQQLFSNIPLKIPQKTIYTQLAIGARSEAIKNAHRALELARVIFPCVHSAGNGIPLAAEKKQSDFKTFFLDIGLVSSSLGIQIDSLHKDLNSVARGALAEQFIAQHLLDNRELFERPHLYYWNRQKKGSTSEVDFLASHESKIIPIEVKSGKAGSMKSLHVFMELKAKTSTKAVRFLNQLPLKQKIVQKDRSYDLINLPHYFVEHWHRFMD